ncbi:MAG: RHS repeat-associated core domain-containing protein, partial [Byssovorax sp.]
GAVYDSTSITYAPYWRVDSRNAEGQLTHATLGDGTIGIRTYEPETGLLASVSEGQALALIYGYYADGSLATRQDTLADRSETFTYDAFHRLATWNLQKGPEIGYHYDDLGNLTEIWSKPTPWSASTLQEKNTYGTNGKPHALTQGLRGAYTYDARGRQDTAPGRSLVTYNEHDLPRKITSSSGSETLFAYDAGGTRVKKQGPSETLLTLGGLYERRTVAGHIQHIFSVTGSDEGPVARIVSEQGEDLAKAKATYLHHDPRLGSVAAVTDAGGALKEAFYYEPFGQRTDAHGKPLTSSPSEVKAGFTGHEHDDDLGLINMRGRMFDPVIRRFLSPDPHVTNPLLGQSYNRYSYVLNNPTNLIDPTGFDCIGQECSGGGSEYTSSGFESTHGNDYSGAFTRVEPSAPSGFSGSAVGGNGAGAPVQAAERQRLVSMPTGPSAPAGAISGPTVSASGGADKWNPYSAEGRIHQGLFGGEPGWQDPLEPYKPALAKFSASLIPGLNSYIVLNDPEASTASKVFAVGTDVLAVVGVGSV